MAGADSPIVLALDGADVLTEDDRRLIADLATRLPVGLFLRVGFGTYGEHQQAQVEDLLAAGETVAELSLDKLSTAVVREWLEAEGEDPELADEVHRNTGGYPLDIADAIQQLTSGGEPSDVEPSQQFKMRSRQAWRVLDPDTQAVARQLAVFEQPLPEEWLREACGLSPAHWGAAVERLRRARILSTVVNGVPWFHPKRRQGILEALGESEREQLEEAAGRAIQAYLSYAAAAAAPQLTADIASLALQLPAALEGEPSAGAAAALDRSQLAIAAALLDVFEPRSHPPLANAVLQHARDFFAGQGDLVPALERLTDLGLVVFEGDERVGGFLRPNFGTATAVAVVQGRALLELGRLPLPGLVSSVFDVALRPRLEPFVNAVYGLGRGTMREFVETAASLGQAPRSQFVGRGQGEFLIIGACFHERPISATVRFASADDRDNARASIDGLKLAVLGGALEVIDVVDHPTEALPADRFVGAVERGLGRQLTHTAALKLEMETPYDPDTYMGLRVSAFELIHGRCDETERRIYGLDQPPSIHWYLSEDTDVLIQGEAYGGEPRAIRHDQVPALNANDSLTFFKYAEAFGLAEGERLLRLNHRGGRPFRDDPVVEVIGELRDKARSVTRHQVRVRIAVDVPTLQARLRAARTRELADARALTSGVLLNGQQMPAPHALATYVCIHRPERRGYGPPLSFSYIETTSRRARKRSTSPTVRHRGFGSSEDTLKRYGEVFDQELRGEFIRGLHGDATQGVAALLGYNSGDIILVNADDHPADAW